MKLLHVLISGLQLFLHLLYFIACDSRCYYYYYIRPYCRCCSKLILILIAHSLAIAKMFLGVVEANQHVIDVRLVEKLVSEILQQTLSDELLNLIIQMTEGAHNLVS